MHCSRRVANNRKYKIPNCVFEFCEKYNNITYCIAGPLNCMNPATQTWELCGVVSWGARCAEPGSISTITIFFFFMQIFFWFQQFKKNHYLRFSWSVHASYKVSVVDKKQQPLTVNRDIGDFCEDAL